MYYLHNSFIMYQWNVKYTIYFVNIEGHLALNLTN